MRRSILNVALLVVMFVSIVLNVQVNHLRKDLDSLNWYTLALEQKVGESYWGLCRWVSKNQGEVEPKLTDAVQKTIKSAVTIVVRGEIFNQKTGKWEKASYQGAGVVYCKGGYILTAGHMVGIPDMCMRNSEVHVIAYDGTDFIVKSYAHLFPKKGEETNLGDFTDLALLQINPGDYEFHPAELGDKNPELASTIFTIGNPTRKRFSVASGIVSRIGLYSERSKELILQTDMAINPGNSGGAIFGLDGKLYGIVSFSQNYTQTGRPRSGLHFCVPVSEIRKHIQELISKLEKKNG